MFPVFPVLWGSHGTSSWLCLVLSVPGEGEKTQGPAFTYMISLKLHSSPADTWCYTYFVDEKGGLRESFVQGQVAILSKSQNLV